MFTRSVKLEPIWVCTDCEGQIEDISRAAGELLGVRARGQNLFLFFPMHTREMAFDMEVALTGWPGRRLARLEPLARRPLLVEYEVSTKLGPDGIAVNWFFSMVAVGETTCSH